MEFIEISAKNVDDAITQATVQLGVISLSMRFLIKEVPVFLESEVKMQ